MAHSLLWNYINKVNRRSVLAFQIDKTGEGLGEDSTFFYAQKIRNVKEQKDIDYRISRFNCAGFTFRAGLKFKFWILSLSQETAKSIQRYTHSKAEERRRAVEAVAGQAKEFDLECQKNVKFAIKDVEAEIVTPSYLCS